MLSTQWALDASASFDFENWKHDGLERPSKESFGYTGHLPGHTSHRSGTDLQVIHAMIRLCFSLHHFVIRFFLFVSI